jgi:hypothetical protein
MYPKYKSQTVLVEKKADSNSVQFCLILCLEKEIGNAYADDVMLGSLMRPTEGVNTVEK